MAPSNHQKHQAGRHLAVAEALLQGYSASLDGPQTFVKINGRTAAVQVAAQGGWMIADIDKMTAMSTDLYVLVDVTDGRRAFYVVPGDDLRSGGGASGTTSSWRASAAFARATRTAGTRRSTRSTLRHGGISGHCLTRRPSRRVETRHSERLPDGSASGRSAGCAPV
ncbi:hypothetical protein ABGB16_10645 [Micromonospora sp. B11E3]|uniref:hypothetical protein n=1 Tax=Micromonospora sp. B11E3 TaxID=3153562 RepID=UPI00325DD922